MKSHMSWTSWIPSGFARSLMHSLASPSLPQSLQEIWGSPETGLLQAVQCIYQIYKLTAGGIVQDAERPSG